MPSKTAAADSYAPEPLSLLPLGAVKPMGWLRDQLQTQADGLTGHIDEFWPDLGPDSGWLGGEGESWEIGPYYLDGLVPLAFGLQDLRLIGKAERWIDAVLARQRPDGWLGPVSDPHEPWHGSFDVWPVTILLKALIQYHEATEDQRVLDGMARFLTYLSKHLPESPLRNWGRFRWPDLLLNILWFHGKTEDPAVLNLADLVHRQGYDWSSHFRRFQFAEKVRKGEEGFDFRTHGVNNAMGLKGPAVWHRLSAEDAILTPASKGLQWLDRFHGQATGVFTSDGHLAGLDPSQGTELCSVVELMFSLETMISLLGDPSIADRLEQVAYNALPGAFSPDMWKHQYDQQSNQVLCTLARREWTTNWPDSNLFGLEPSFSCCTANMHQGWPKFVRALWMSSPEGGLAATGYGPCTVEAKVNGRVQVEILEETDYPFGEDVVFRISTEAPVRFPLILRIPGWCDNAEVSLGDGTRIRPASGQFTRLVRTWNTNEEVRLHLPMRVRAEVRPNGAVVLLRGPLVLTLPVEEEWRPIPGVPPLADRTWHERIPRGWAKLRDELPCANSEVIPKSEWNYALEVDPEFPHQSAGVTSLEVGRRPFSPEGAPLQVKVRGRILGEWVLQSNSAGPPPPGPSRLQCGPAEELTLIPYGSTCLRVTEFPWLRHR